MARIGFITTLIVPILMISGCQRGSFRMPSADEVSVIRVKKWVADKDDRKALSDDYKVLATRPWLKITAPEQVAEILTWMRTIDFSTMEDTHGTVKLVEPLYYLTIVYSGGSEVSFSIRPSSIWKDDRHFWRVDVQKFEEVITKILNGRKWEDLDKS